MYQSGIGMLISSLLLWLAVLLTTAARIHKLPPDVYDVRLGPWTLHTIAKQTIDGTNTVTFTVESGFIGYSLVCLLCGLAGGWLLWLYRRHRATEV